MSVTQTVLDTKEYERIVNEIKNQNDEILNGFSALSEADSGIKNNSIIPQFVKADSDVINMLQKLKQQIGVVINTMETFESKIIETNQDAADSGSTLA